MLVKKLCLTTLATAVVVLAPLSAHASTRTQSVVPSAAAPLVTGVEAGGGPYVTVFDPQGQWRAGFLSYLDFTVGGIHIATADVNGDGETDVITAPGRGGRADLRAFDGDGKQLMSLFAGAGSCGTAIAAGDVNGDGTADLVAGNEQCGSPNVQVFDGKTRARIAFFGVYSDPNGSDGTRVAAGDVDGDDKAEIVTANGPGEPPTVRVFAGVPTEFFPKPISSFDAFPGSVTTGVQVGVGDVTGDGRDDIVAAAETADDVQVKVFDGRTDALLTTVHAFGLVSPGTLSVATGDLDGDGTAEILAAGAINGWQHEIRVFRLDGTQVASFVGPSYVRRSIAAGDLDGDGKAEILAATGPGYYAGVTVIDPATGDTRSFGAYEYSFTGGVRVAAGDLAGDGHTEWVTGQGPGGSSELGVFDGSGAQLLELHPFGDVWSGLYVAAGDVNGDRKADIVAGAGEWQEPRVKAFDGQGRELASFLAFDQSFQGGVRVATGDMDGDGSTEIIAGAGPGGPPLVRVFDFTGKQKTSFYAFDPRFAGGVYVASADLDGDGQAEIVAGSGQAGGPQVRVFDATGKLLTSFDAYESTFAGGVHVAAGDIDGDGRAEIVTGPGPGRPADVKTFASDGSQVASFRANPDFQGGWFVAVQTPLGPRLRVGVIPTAGVEGRRPVRISATVVDPGGTAPASAFAATISWGDGTQSTGEVTAGPAGTYVVKAANVYRRHGVYSIAVQVTDVLLRATVVNARVPVSDAPVVVRGRSLGTRRLTFRGVVATVIDQNRFAAASDLKATVDWGDGRRAAARLVPKGAGRFEVVASHRYRESGLFHVVTRVRDAGGSRASATTRMRVVAR
jgi:hypothetical protein